jgi:hypothetical protein
MISFTRWLLALFILEASRHMAAKGIIMFIEHPVKVLVPFIDCFTSFVITVT